MMVGKQAQHIEGTWANMTSHQLTTVRRPIRIRCLEACLHDVMCKAVNYKPSQTCTENCVLLASIPLQPALVRDTEWNLIIYM